MMHGCTACCHPVSVEGALARGRGDAGTSSAGGRVRGRHIDLVDVVLSEVLRQVQLFQTADHPQRESPEDMSTR